jgi:Leucine-rich repeat (LRR) protein
MKNISTKAKEELEKQKKKAINIKLVCCSLLLCYNKIRSLQSFEPVIEFVMPECKNLQWIDLSHNYLEKLDYNFQGFPQLRTLYLHCNYLADLNDFAALSSHKQLKTLMIHGNPIAAVPNFRSFLISMLPNLKKIDSVLVSKKEVDNAMFLRTQVKKFPLPKNPTKPPVEKSP